MEEFWGVRDTTILFCEDAYKKSNYIAEYYNSLSGISYSLVGIYFLNTKFKNISYTLISLGIGTIFLHATQRWYGQYLDELSMLFLSFQVIEYLRKKQKQMTSYLWIPLGLSIYLHNYNFIFLFMFSTSQLYILFFLKKPLPKKNYKLTVQIYNFIYKSTFIFSLILWLIDQIFCIHVKPYYLHAWWHVGTSISIFFGLNELLICQ
tara:strand:- start:6535 stop:7152 length:618 start_codon:yes stop_codon:yes gene_type:complete